MQLFVWKHSTQVYEPKRGRIHYLVENVSGPINSAPFIGIAETPYIAKRQIPIFISEPLLHSLRMKLLSPIPVCNIDTSINSDTILCE